MWVERNGCVWEHPGVCGGLFVCGVNIGVKRRGHTDHRLGGQRRRERNYVHCAKHKSTPVGRITTASYLCLPFFVNSQHRSRAYNMCVYVSPGLVSVTPCTHSPSDNSMLLFASQASCLAACAIQAYWTEERQFGSAQLPVDQCHSSHCQSL